MYQYKVRYIPRSRRRTGINTFKVSLGQKKNYAGLGNDGRGSKEPTCRVSAYAARAWSSSLKNNQSLN